MPGGVLSEPSKGMTARIAIGAATASARLASVNGNSVAHKLRACAQIGDIASPTAP